MRRHTPIILAIFFLSLPSAFSTPVTDFGNAAASFGTWNYNPATSTISGTESAGDLLYGNSVTLDLTGRTVLSLTGNASVAPAGFFSITLVDQVGHEAIARFRWSDFAGGATISRALSFTTFNLAHVESWSLDSGGSAQAVNATFNRLVAVPEPSYWAAGFVALLASGIVRRELRKRSPRA